MRLRLAAFALVASAAALSFRAPVTTCYERRFYSGVLAEAAKRQALVRRALELELQRAPALPDAGALDARSEKMMRKVAKRLAEVPRRLNEVSASEALISSLQLGLEGDVENVRKAILADELLAGVLRGFDLEAHTRNNEPRGRPEGFEGVVLQTPMGVPVLVGAASEFGHLRRVSQGSDLFFQCKYDRGARVLLRTSLQRGTKGSRACTQFAADVAAWFSDARHDEKVPVAYTNARQGGGGSRCIKEDQRLGAIVARPRSVANVALAAQQRGEGEL
mmetsp:Transcript_18270/g.62844  ORF Transcript_18270/g.62844 Transcript_18270/m.62844 type:complete len:277 (-) Transcript_18270:1038-1868(-)